MSNKDIERIEYLNKFIEYLKDDNTKETRKHIINFNNELIEKSQKEIEQLSKGEKIMEQKTIYKFKSIKSDPNTIDRMGFVTDPKCAIDGFADRTKPLVGIIMRDKLVEKLDLYGTKCVEHTYDDGTTIKRQEIDLNNLIGFVGDELSEERYNELKDIYGEEMVHSFVEVIAPKQQATLTYRQAGWEDSTDTIYELTLQNGDTLYIGTPIYTLEEMSEIVEYDEDESYRYHSYKYDEDYSAIGVSIMCDTADTLEELNEKVINGKLNIGTPITKGMFADLKENKDKSIIL